MDRSFIVSSPHFSGAIQRSFVQAKDKQEVQTKIEKPDEWKAIQAEQYPKQTGKKRRLPSLSLALRPSHIKWKHDNTFGKILSFFEKIVHLFEKIWPNRPPKIDHRLFHALTSSNETLRNALSRELDTQPKMSDIFDVTLRFLKKEKKRKSIPEALIKELAQCKDWAKQLESVERSTQPKEQEKITKKISQEIVKKIQTAKEGESILIPGGWCSKEPKDDRRGLYRITKKANNHLDVQVISRDPELQDAVSLAAAGKDKILPEVTFAGIPEKEINHPAHWNALLDLQMIKKGDTYSIGATSIKTLFQRFTDKQVAPSDNPRDYATPKTMSSHGQNLWRVIDCVAFPNQKKGERLERLHLERDLTLFGQFFANSYSHLKENQTHQLLLQEGIENISRKASLLHERGFIDEKEVAFVQKELSAAEAVLERAKNGNPKRTRKKWFKDLPRPDAFRFTYSSSQLKKLDISRHTSEENGNETGSGRDPASLPADAISITTPNPLPPLDVASLSEGEAVRHLPTVREECEKWLEQKQYALVQHRIHDLFLQFPFSASTAPFGMLSAEEATKGCQEILSLSQLLAKSCKESQIVLPEQVLLLTKMGYVQYQMAHSHSATSKLLPEFHCQSLKVLQSSLGRIQRGYYSSPIFVQPSSFISGTYKNLIEKMENLDGEYSKKFSAYLSSKSSFSGNEIDIRENIFSLQKKEKNSAILQSICRHLETIDSLIPVLSPKRERMRFTESEKIADNIMEQLSQSWLRPFAHTCFRQAIARGAVLPDRFGRNQAQETAETEKEKKKEKPFDPNKDMQPEAVADDPASILQLLAKMTKNTFPTEKGPLPLSSVKKEDLRDILFVLTHRLSLQGVMGLLQNKPHLLSLPDVRAICYHAAFDRTQGLSHDDSHPFTNECIDNPTILSTFPSWLQKQISFFQSQGKIEEALFLIEMNHRWIQKCQESKQDAIHQGAANAHDYLPTLKEWARQSLSPSHPLAPQKNRIWRELVHHYHGRDTLNADDMELLSVARVVLQGTHTDAYDRMPHKEQEILYVLERTKEPILKALRSNVSLRNAVLDRICQAQRVALPADAQWTGEGPTYQLGDYEVQIQEGIFTNRKTGKTNRPFSTAILDDVNVAEAFSTLSVTSIPTTAKIDKQETHYFFVDGKNNPSHIIETEKERRIYKEFSLNGKKLALQYLPRKEIIPDRINLQNLQEASSIKEAVKLLWKIVKQSFQPAFPTFLAREDCRFWVDPKNPKNVFVFDQEGSPLYQFQFSRRLGYRVLTKGADLRNGTDQVVLRPVQTLQRNTRTFWRPFAHFDDPGNVLLWRNKKGEIEKVDLLRFGLQFVKKGEQLLCTHPSYSGWIYDGKEQSPLAKRGLTGSLLLTHPTQKDKKRVIIPHHPIEKEPDQSRLPPLRNIIRMVIQHIKKQSPALRVDDPLANSWTKNTTAARADFFSFDLDPHTLRWSTPSPKAAEQFLYLSLLSCYEGKCNRAFEFLQLAQGHISDSLTNEEHALIEQITGHVLLTPQSIGLKLHAALLQMKHSSETERAKAKKSVGSFYKRYLEFGHKIPRIYRLNKQDEAACLTAIDLPFAGRHLSQIFHSETHPKNTKKASFQKRDWHQQYPPQNHDIANVASDLLQNMAKQEQKKQDYKRDLEHSQKLSSFQRKFSSIRTENPEDIPFATRSSEVLTHHFDALYRAAHTASLESEDFLQIEAYVRSLGQEEEKNLVVQPQQEDKKTKPPLAQILRHYLLTVLDIRRAKPDFIGQLPTFDVVVNEDDFYRSGESSENFTKVKDFFTKLIKIHKQAFPSPTDETQNATDEEKNKAKKIQKILSQMDNYFGAYLEELLDEGDGHLETRLASAEKNKAPLPLPSIEEAAGSELFAKEDVQSLFQKEDAYQSSAHRIPDLSSLDGDPEEAVQLEKKKIKDEVQTAITNKKKADLYVIGNEEKRNQCVQIVEKKRKGLEEEMCKKKAELLALFQPKDSPKHLLYKQAGFLPWTEVSDLLKACLQNDQKKLHDSLPKGVAQERLDTVLFEYIDIASREMRCGKALELLDEMAPDKGGTQRSASDTVYHILTGKRQYDPRKHLHLAALELYLGFLLRPNQLNTVIEMVNDPKAVRQAATGAGKTTVINFLNAVMKADGSNLVTMIFPQPLYEENQSYLHQYLGKLYERNTYRLDFSEQTPETVDNGERSVFQRIYGELHKTIQDKGVVATTRQSMQALEKSFLKRLYHWSTRGDTVKEMEMTHLIYTAKILRLFEERGVQVVDEFDSILSPRERQDLAMAGGKAIQYPSFIREEAMRIYDKLYACKELGLDKNIQAERFSQHGEAILNKVTSELAVEWQIQIGCDTNILSRYFRSQLSEQEENNLSPQLATLPLEVRDRFAVTKELLSDFIPLALQKKEDGKYKRSQNGVDTINCSSPGVPREGSKPREILETMCYTIQDYLYRGVSPTKIRFIVEDASHQAEKELNPLGKDLDETGDDLNAQQVVYSSIDETPAAQAFLTRFPQSLHLSAFTGKNKEKAIQQLTDWVNNTEAKKRTFLSEQLERLEDSSTKISCTSANYVSMVSKTGGASATTGNPHAYPSQMNTENVTHPGTVGEMILTLQEKTKQGTVEKYNPEEPLALIQKCIREKGVQSLVDGGVALTGAVARDIAQSLLQQLPDRSPIQGVAFFDEKDNIVVLTKDGKTESISMSPLGRNQISMALLASHSRGANVQIGPGNHLLITDNSLETLENKLQTFGRSRAKDHKITIATPENDPITTVDQSIAAGIRSGALEGSDNLVRAKQQELDDIIRRNMLSKLLSCAASLSSNKKPALPSKESIDLQKRLLAIQADSTLSQEEKARKADEVKREEETLLEEIKRKQDNNQRDLAALFARYQQAQFLVQVGHRDFSDDGTYHPGKYFANHGKILRKNQDPKKVLEEKVDDLQQIAENCELESAKQELEKWQCLFEAHESVKDLSDFSKKTDKQIIQEYPDVYKKLNKDSLFATPEEGLQRLRHLHTILQQMPSKIPGKDGYDTETSVDLDTESEVDTDVQVNVHEESKKDQPFYQPWRRCLDRQFKLHSMNTHMHSGYDPIIQTTENVHPLGRKDWADPIFHRTPHDKSQMPLHYIRCEIDTTTNQWVSVTAIDPLDVVENTKSLTFSSNRWTFDYDLRTNQIFRKEKSSSNGLGLSSTNTQFPADKLKDLRNYVAQIRFEDGQYQASSYTKGQWKALKQWLQQQNLIETEKYFLGEVLKNRPDDRAQYKGSDLNKLFIELKKKKQQTV